MMSEQRGAPTPIELHWIEYLL